MITLILCFVMQFSVFAKSAPPNQPLIHSYGKGLCQLPGFKCIDVSSYRDWDVLFPNKLKREIVMRLNRINAALYYSKTIVVPTNWRNLDYMNLSPFPFHRETHGKKLLLVDLRVFAFGAYNAQGNLEFWGPASGGKSWCNELNRSCKTLAGDFRIFRIQGEACKSSAFPINSNGGASMPYCMHYFRGFALHGAILSGFKHHSHGCIRLFEDDVKWLNYNFVSRGTRIIVMT
jgi:L,D-transpeptidase ErfK/SrfK